MTIAASGLSGMVGSRIVELLSQKYTFEAFGLDDEYYRGNPMIFSFHKTDITNEDDVLDFISSTSAEVILHLAAMTDVDGCEREKGLGEKSQSWKVNVEGARLVAEGCKKNDKKMIFISTETVFGDKGGPFGEDEATFPKFADGKISWYGWTKNQAEEIILEISQESVIVRISYPFRAYFPPKGDFARNMLDRFKNGSLYPLYDDQYLTPTFIDDLATGLDFLIESKASGKYHLASSDLTTPLLFGEKLIEKFFGRDELAKLKKTKFENKSSLAPRPKNGGLKIDKIKKLGFDVRETKDFIEDIFRQQKVLGLI